MSLSSAVIAKVFLSYMLCFSDLTCRKLWTPGVAIALELKPEKINECTRCKVLTDSFSHWHKKTSRGKYEGGDTAWEEAKLKTYARSEIRFVEIQEGLCSELSDNQNDCYVLAEEAEQVLEKWWFHEDPDTVDLHTWLCIETLKHCCPKNHFGESCILCPLDKNNKICNGNGRCDGAGTRNGNGLCICNRGYAGNFCEECSKNYYATESSCNKCDRACDGCSGAGPAACQSCKTGWKLDTGVCKDIDECESSICEPNQYCVNNEGSYKCKTCDSSCENCVGAGPLNCTSCAPTNHLLNGECLSDSQKSEITKSAINRMTIYVAMFVILGILYQADRRIGVLVFIIFALYIYYTEKSQKHVNTFEVFFKHIMGTEAWF